MARQAVTDHNLAPVVQVFVWFCLVLAILTVVTRLCIKVKVVNQTGLDDLCIMLSLLLATSQSVAVSVATSNGLGASANVFKDANERTRLETSYAAEILFVLSSCFSKLSLLLFVRTLSPKSGYRKLGQYVGIVVGVWAISGVFIMAFQCGLPEPWRMMRNQCLDIAAAGTYIGVLNALTDIVLIVLPVSIVLPIQIQRSRKAWVIIVFAARLSVVAAIVGQIVYLNQASRSDDPTLVEAPLAICTQLAQMLSIGTTCAVYLKPLLDSLESGFISVGDLRRQQSEGFGYIPKGSGFLNVLSSFSRRDPKSKRSRSKATASALNTEPTIPEELEVGTPIELSTTELYGQPGRPIHQQQPPPQGSNTGQSQILQTNEWTVQYQYHQPPAVEVIRGI